MKKIILLLLIFFYFSGFSIAKETFLRCENEIDSRNTTGVISKSIYHYLIDKKKDLNLLKTDFFMLKKDTNYSTKEYGIVGGPVNFDIGQNRAPLTEENDTYLIYGKVLKKTPSSVTKINKYTLEMINYLYDYKGFGTANVDTSQIVFSGTVIHKCTVLDKKL